MSGDLTGSEGGPGFSRQHGEVIRQLLMRATREWSPREVQALPEARAAIACIRNWSAGWAVDVPHLKGLVTHILAAGFARRSSLNLEPMADAIARSLHEDDECRTRIERWVRGIREGDA